MPREAKGTLRSLADGFAARITVQGRERKDFELVACSSEAEAGVRCKELASMAARLRRAGNAGEIEQLLEMGAKARAGRPWAAVCAAVDALCAHAPRLQQGRLCRSHRAVPAETSRVDRRRNAEIRSARRWSDAAQEHFPTGAVGEAQSRADPPCRLPGEVGAARGSSDAPQQARNVARFGGALSRWPGCKRVVQELEWRWAREPASRGARSRSFGSIGRSR
jgi:hypothetical protein